MLIVGIRVVGLGSVSGEHARELRACNARRRGGNRERYVFIRQRTRQITDQFIYVCALSGEQTCMSPSTTWW